MTLGAIDLHFFDHILGKPEWGTLPTGVASAIAALTFLLGYRTYRRDSNDKRREQAARIGVTQEQLEAHVLNGSDAPIYFVGVTFDDVNGIPCALGLTSHDCILPGASVTIRGHVPVSNSGLFPSVRFQDALGRRWHRSRSGKLRELRGIKYPDKKWWPYWKRGKKTVAAKLAETSAMWQYEQRNRTTVRVIEIADGQAKLLAPERFGDQPFTFPALSLVAQTLIPPDQLIGRKFNAIVTGQPDDGPDVRGLRPLA